MITVKVEGLSAVQSYLANVGSQVRFATAVALTRTAKQVAEEMPAAMERELDRPTEFTRRGLYIQGARKDKLTAVVAFKDRQAAYMRFQIEGGLRPAGPRGIKLPGNIQLNAFGNIPKGTIDKLKAAARDGSLGTALSRRLGAGNRRKGAAPIQLFVGRPTGRGWESAPMGIWRRIPGTAGGPGKLVPVIVFDDQPARYRPRFRFADHAAAVIRREWPRQFETALAEALRTAR